MIREIEMPHLLKGVGFKILVEWYNVVTPFGQKVKELPPTLTPEP